MILRVKSAFHANRRAIQRCFVSDAMVHGQQKPHVHFPDLEARWVVTWYCVSAMQIKRVPGLPQPRTPMMWTQVEELPEAASRTIAAEWGTQTAGGSHIHPDWKKNPCFHLKLRTTGPAKVRERLAFFVYLISSAARIKYR